MVDSITLYKIQKKITSSLLFNKIMDDYVIGFFGNSSKTKEDLKIYDQMHRFIDNEFLILSGKQSDKRPDRKCSNSQLRAFMKYKYVTKMKCPEMYEKYLERNPWVLQNDKINGRPKKQIEMIRKLIIGLDSLRSDLVDPKPAIIEWIDNQKKKLESKII